MNMKFLVVVPPSIYQVVGEGESVSLGRVHKPGAQAQTHQKHYLPQWFVDTSELFTDTTVFNDYNTHIAG